METIQIQNLSVDELKVIITDSFREQLKGLIPKPEPPEKYLTRKETAKLLQVSLVTLNDWSKKGIIQSYRINSRIRYKKSEIDEALKEVKNLKYRRA